MRILDKIKNSRRVSMVVEFIEKAMEQENREYWKDIWYFETSPDR